MEDKILKLTNAVYKVLDFFPESDPLKNRAKDKALSIMEHLVLINETSGWASFQNEKIKVHILEDIDILLGYLWVGKSQGWLNSVNCLIIANEYEKIRKGIEPDPMGTPELTQKLPGMGGAPTPDKKTQEAPVAVANPVLSRAEDRQKQILEFLGRNEKAQVMDLQTILPDITKRTIRRDLDELIEAGKIVRLGDFNQIFYRVKG